MFKIDPKLNYPLYLQIVAQVKRVIAIGVLGAGEKLPSVRELARSLTINPNTIVKAYGELEREGLVETIQGKGTFVVEKGTTQPQKLKEELLRKLIKKFLIEASSLNIPKEEMKKIMLDHIDRWYKK